MSRRDPGGLILGPRPAGLQTSSVKPRVAERNRSSWPSQSPTGRTPVWSAAIRHTSCLLGHFQPRNRP